MTPGVFRSIRFRLALTYTVLVFGLAAIVIGGVNLALSRSLKEYPISSQTQFRTFIAPDGSRITVEETVRGRFVTLEQLVNERALENLRRVSMWSLLGLFPASLAIGWWVADRALRPIGRISAVARDLQASDLSQRIALDGPDDELKHLADTFDAMLGRIESAVESQRRFIQDTSHELRNPLAVMATNLDVVLDDPEADVDELRRVAEVVRRTVDRTASTVDDLIAFARTEVPETQRTPIDLQELAAEVLEEYSGPIESASLAVVGLGEGATAVAHRDSVKRAFSNLVGNAVRLSRPGTTLRVGSGERASWAWLGIEDQGPGIDEREHELVFRRFYSKDPTSLESESRSGLGLAITRQIAESHGGTVTVRSVRGAGAAFVIWLPMAGDAARATVTEDGVHPVWDPFSVGEPLPRL